MKNAYIAARRAFADPSTPDGTTSTASRGDIYTERWAYAVGSAFDVLADWGRRILAYGLYGKTRLWYNPTARLVDFYEGALYPGVVATPEVGVPRGERDALPFVGGTGELHAAVLQAAQWSNWSTQKGVISLLGAALGDVFVEVVDDVDKGVVYLTPWWPGFVSDLVLDERGNVKAYKLEYEYEEREEDSRGKTRAVTHVFTQAVDGSSIKTYRDNKPWSPAGEEAADRPNPYGFVPAVWIRHSSVGSIWGEPAMRSTPKLDLLNSLFARANDYLAVRMRAPTGLAGEFDPRGIRTLDQAGARAAEQAGEAASEYADTVGGEDGDDFFLTTLPPGTTNVPLFGNLEPEAVIPFVERALAELEADYPELSAFTKLREMSNASGIAIARALGDTESRLARVQSSYDQQVVKAFQMAVAIGGWRSRSGAGGWRDRTAARKYFAPFDLASYAAGDLNFALELRPLIVPTAEEETAASVADLNRIALEVDLGLTSPQRELMRRYNLDEAEAQKMFDEIAAENARARPVDALGDAATARAQAVLRPFTGEVGAIEPVITQ